MALFGAIPVEFGHVFPAGAFALGVEPVNDFDTGKPAKDKDTGELVWAVDVIDADPNARGKAKSVKVKVIGPVCPVLPEEAPGLPFRPVEFEGLTATPWVELPGGKDKEGAVAAAAAAAAGSDLESVAEMARDAYHHRKT